MAKMATWAIKDLTSQAGFASGNEQSVATAIALAESGGDPNAHNTKPPDDSYGLWQINMLGSLGPSRRRQFGIKTNAELFDPLVNAKAAHKVFADAGNSFKPWSTYNDGAYKKFMAGASNLKVADQQQATADAQAQAQASAAPGGGILDGLTGIPDAIYQFNETVRKSVITASVIGIALVLLILGVVILTSKTVLNVIPAGKAVKVAKAVL